MIKENKEELDEQLYAAYWYKLQQSKYDLIYYELSFKGSTIATRVVKYITIGVTSLATGAWITWNGNHLIASICAVLILLLQVFSAVSDYFPYEKRKDELKDMLAELRPVFREMENEWRLIRSNERSNAEIRQAILQNDERQEEIKKHYFKDDSLPIKGRLRSRADELTSEYFENFV